MPSIWKFSFQGYVISLFDCTCSYLIQLGAEFNENFLRSLVSSHIMETHSKLMKLCQKPHKSGVVIEKVELSTSLEYKIWCLYQSVWYTPCVSDIFDYFNYSSKTYLNQIHPFCQLLITSERGILITHSYALYWVITHWTSTEVWSFQSHAYISMQV